MTQLLFARARPSNACLFGRILEQQKAFQAMKKASGNTFTARGMPANIVVSGVVLFGGMAIIMRNCVNMAYGRNKIELSD